MLTQTKDQQSRDNKLTDHIETKHLTCLYVIFL